VEYLILKIKHDTVTRRQSKQKICGNIDHASLKQKSSSICVQITVFVIKTFGDFAKYLWLESFYKNVTRVEPSQHRFSMWLGSSHWSSQAITGCYRWSQIWFSQCQFYHAQKVYHFTNFLQLFIRAVCISTEMYPDVLLWQAKTAEDW